jgi:hypothetical protein
MARLAIFEAGVQLVAEAPGQPRDFSGACLHTFKYFFMGRQ